MPNEAATEQDQAPPVLERPHADTTFPTPTRLARFNRPKTDQVNTPDDSPTVCVLHWQLQ